jgi:hypothetical protein
LNKILNADNHKTVNAEALNGTGVDETFRSITLLLLNQFSTKHKIGLAPPYSAPTPPPQPQRSGATVQRLPAKQKAPPALEKPKAPETIQEETLPAPDAASGMSSSQMDKPTVSEASEAETSASEELYDESHFAPREMPSIDEIPSVTEHPLGIAGATAGDISAALHEIISKLKESQVEAWLEKLTYSSDSTKQTLSELIAELNESRKNQEQMIDLLKKIESALRPKAKTAKRA